MPKERPRHAAEAAETLPTPTVPARTHRPVPRDGRPFLQDVKDVKGVPFKDPIHGPWRNQEPI